jgi:sec-independent protein translocase protein TatB
MPGFGDSAFIVLLALLLFGPKKLPVLARQLGKLMADFRRASTEFRTQMEEELRVSEQADRQKQIAAIEAAAPTTPLLDAPAESSPEPEHPHIPPAEPTFIEASTIEATAADSEIAMPETTPAPLPIATSGELNIMPPATGLPVANTSLSPFVNSIPEVAAPEASIESAVELPHHSNGSICETGSTQEIDPTHESAVETETRPWML